MMKQIVSALAFVLLPLASNALEVGDAAPCVVLNHLTQSGMESQHCIREPEPGTATSFKVLEFFSAVCGDCQKNLPLVSALANEFKGHSTVRLIGIDRDEALIRNYVKEHQQEIHFDVALDTDRDAKKAYGVVATPTIFILNGEDVVVYKHQGVLTDEDLCHIRDTLTGTN